MKISPLSKIARTSLVLAVLAVVGAASAASIQFPISSYSSLTDWSVTRSVSKFNPTLGLLQSVDFFVTAGMNSDIKLGNLSDQSPSDITGTVNTAYSVKDSTGTLTYLSGALQVSKSDTNFAVNPTNSPLYNGAWARSYSYTTDPSLTSTKSFSINTTNATTLLTFTGLSTIDLLIGAAGTSNVTSSNGNAHMTFTTTANTVGYVQYNYQPVPEPSAFAAFGLGALVLVRRRKAKSGVR